VVRFVLVEEDRSAPDDDLRSPDMLFVPGKVVQTTHPTTA